MMPPLDRIPPGQDTATPVTVLLLLDVLMVTDFDAVCPFTNE